MATLQRSFRLLLFFVLLGGFLGGILSEVLQRLSPEGFLPEIFIKGFSIGLNPPFVIDLHLLTFTIGFTLQINLLTLLGIFLGIFTYKQA
jgi:hypothetical protein